MKFRKINENTIRCILSEEDLLENDIVLEDFFQDKNKIHDLMEILIQKAKEEVGFEASGDLFSLQIMPLPRNGLAITFSDSQEEGSGGFLDQLKHTMEQMEDDEKYLPSQNIEHILQGMLDEIESFVPKEKNKTKKDKSRKRTNTTTKIRMYEFDSMENLEAFCSMPSLEKNIKSSLYKDEVENLYYLILEKGRFSMKKFEACCEFAVEFSRFVSDELIQKSYCEEHYACILEKKAVWALRNMIGVQ